MFFDKSYGMLLGVKMEDKMVWTLIGNSKFSVCFFYKFFSRSSIDNSFPRKSVWFNKVLDPRLFFSYGLLLLGNP